MSSSSQPLVSVVIPCFNQAHFLGEAIGSVLAQTYRNFEIIVLNDGSTDDTLGVAARYPHVRCVTQKNQGLSAARNAGLRESRGELLVFLDADDRLLPDALRINVECLSARPECAFVFGRGRVIDSDGSPTPITQPPCAGGDHYGSLLQGNYIWMHQVIFRRVVFDRFGGFDVSLRAAEDYDLYLRIARALPIYGHDEVITEYRKHGGSMSSNNELMLKATMTVLHSQREHVRGRAEYASAYKSGMKFSKEFYAEPLVERVRLHVRARSNWRLTARDVLLLLRYYPRGVAWHAYRKLYCTVFSSKKTSAEGNSGR